MPFDRPDDYPDRGLAIRSVGTRWYHPPGFLVDRPSGSGDFAFMQWLTDSRIRINGIERLERAGGCVVFRPEDPQWFGGDTFTPFGNSWFHFHGPEAGVLLADCSIPTNRVLRLRDDSFVEPLLNLFLRESMARPRLWHRLIESGLQRFFVEVSRSLEGDSMRFKSAREAELQTAFNDLRYEVKKKCTEPWSLKSMAEFVHLSHSRFSQLYKDFFGVNPIDDLIGMRIARAEYYLCMTNMPIGRIASLCGFSDHYYFSRQFKNKIGESPNAYRSLHGGEVRTREWE